MAEGDILANSAPSGDVNSKLQDKQKKIGIAVIVGFILVVYLLVSATSSDDNKNDDVTSQDLTETVQRRPGDKDSFTIISGQVNTLMGQVEKFKQTSESLNQFLEENGQESLLRDIQSTVNDNASTMEDVVSRIEVLERARLSDGGRKTFGQSSGGAVRPDSSRTGSGVNQARPTNTDELFAPRGRTNLSTGGPQRAPVSAIPTTRKQTVIELYSASEGDTAAEDKEAELRGLQTKATAPEVYDTEHYVPPNAYVSARLVVSVDAAIGSSQSADPKAAQFIVTGPARHVQSGNKIEETDMEGCLVNGSAQGNLSSERVFINLHAMTCPLGNGKVAVSEVEGYATHLGKNGIRGTVVSREGDLVTKSIIAGTLEGLGRTAGQFGQFGSGGSGTSLITDRPDSTEILSGSVGQGIASGAGVYSNYLLERARAYEPVVSLPTGIEVELVFISGTLVRPIDQ